MLQVLVVDEIRDLFYSFLLVSLLKRAHIDQVLLAIPSVNRKKRRGIVEDVQQYGVPVLQIPSIED